MWCEISEIFNIKLFLECHDFSHYGYWYYGAADMGKMTLSDCAFQCDYPFSCFAFTHNSDTDACYFYQDEYYVRDWNKVVSATGHHEWKAYIQC